MTQTYSTPQEAEDAYYDALEEGDLEQILSVWSDSDEICCLLPMSPLVQGRDAVKEIFSMVFSRGAGVSLNIHHLHWIETGNIAIHQVEEVVQGAPINSSPPAPFYATNIFRREVDGWRLLLHQNAPTPQPAPSEMIMP